jgi:ribulose-5-phosphate 4-epimerase/fuculose-1-phosphate aldolase
MAMAPASQTMASVKSSVNYVPGEWEVRQRLAACYHLVDFFGWNDSIFNHISVRVPGPDRHFLINPFGLNYFEVTASNLVKVDLEGHAVGAHDVNYAGFLIHSAIHEAREDAHCIIHAHTVAGQAIACKKEGLSHDTFTGALLYGKVAYHDFEGVTLRPDEKPRMVENMGNKRIMILRNHGVLVAGATIENAFFGLWGFMDACEVQVARDGVAGPNIPLSEDIKQLSASVDFDQGGNNAKLFFDAAVRRMKATDLRRYADANS